MRPDFRSSIYLMLSAALLGSGGCATHHRSPATVDLQRPAPSATEAAEPVADDVAAEGSLGPRPIDDPALAPSVSVDETAVDEIPIEDEPLPGEEVSEAPHDELSLVDPDRVEPIETPEEFVAAEPTYDVPMTHNDRVQFWLDYYGNRKRENFRIGLERSGRYVPMFREIFAEAGIPQDLVYMAHVESAYKTTAYSRAHARGIYQFIAATGRRYGLRIDYWVDERLDPEKSARAAARYLTDLHDEFGDWYLALAAYNAGEGKIRRALKRSGRDDFWGIARTRHIRRETKNYVPAILAAIRISRQPELYGLDYVPHEELRYETIEVEGAADLQVLAKCAGTDLDTMKLLNPALRRYQTPPHATTSVRVPTGAGEQTLLALAEVPVNERVLYVRHVVRSGDTLYDLARAYGVTVSAIQQANRMGSRTMIRLNQELVIPSVAAGSYPAAAVAGGEAIPGEPLTYRVRRGDTLSGIARRHGTSAPAIASASGISINSVLRIGQRLTVVPGVRSSSRAARIAQGPPPPVESGASVVHVVRRGESLSVIARRYRTTAAAIAAANGISVDKLLPIGQRLNVVPGARSAAEAVRVASAGAAAPDGGAARTHTVRRGESLWTIANRYSTTVDLLCAWNGISRSTTLYPGTRLTVSLK